MNYKFIQTNTTSTNNSTTSTTNDDNNNYNINGSSPPPSKRARLSEDQIHDNKSKKEDITMDSTLFFLGCCPDIPGKFDLQKALALGVS